MLGMGEPAKQNGEERRARLGFKPSSAAVPDKNVQQENMSNISRADPGPITGDAEQTANYKGVICRLGKGGSCLRRTGPCWVVWPCQVR